MSSRDVAGEPGSQGAAGAAAGKRSRTEGLPRTSASAGGQRTLHATAGGGGGERGADPFDFSFGGAKGELRDAKPRRSLEEASNAPTEYEGTTRIDERGHTEYHGTFHGSHFPGVKYRNDLKVVLNGEIKDEYLTALDHELPGITRGMKLLMTAMTHMEGFNKRSTSYATHNPGNINNKDDGERKQLPSLEDGVRYQYEHLLAIATGKDKLYPIGKHVDLAPYYSKDIAAHTSYGKSPYVPGYEFTYTGQLDQFIKIYSTGARAGNTYLNTIVSYFAQNGVTITPEMTLAEIIAIE